MAVTRRTLRLQAQLTAELANVTDQQARDLVGAWASAWDEISPDLTAALVEQLVAGDRVTRAQLLRSTRLRRALQVIADHLTVLARDAGVRITADLQRVIDTAGAAQASVIDSQLPAGTDLVTVTAWSRVDPAQIAAIVKRSTEQITSRTRPLPAEHLALVRRELVRGVAAGSNPRQTAARIVRRAEGRFNGGLTRALVIARTETLDAHRAAAEVAQAQHADVLAGWSWLAKLDALTCRSCWAQHGRTHPLSEAGPLDHQQGRCARLPVTRSWADLGFAVEEPPSLMPSAEDQFAALTEAEQIRVLGRRGHAAWLAGEFEMDSWSARRTTPDWRASYGVAPAPSQSGGRVSRTAA